MRDIVMIGVKLCLQHKDMSSADYSSERLGLYWWHKKTYNNVYCSIGHAVMEGEGHGSMPMLSNAHTHAPWNIIEAG